MSVHHFLTLKDLSNSELQRIIAHASEMKNKNRAGELYQPLKNKTLGMVFEKSSTRTRVSFEVGMTQLGGHAIFLSPRDTQLGRGEPIEDTARVLSRMVDIIMVRTYEHEKIEKFAAYSQTPVINALTDLYHPCQLLADLQTYTEHRGNIKGATVAWVGDGNNMCHSYINAAALCDFTLNIACPQDYQPMSQIVQQSGSRVNIMHEPAAAAENADLVVTDVWSSMGHEQEQNDRALKFKDFIVDQKLMALAKKDALFMHCLPAHRGEEVSADVLDGTQSVIWEEAENRLHSQKALLCHLMGVA
jgi:ornithine carbamoyltransferase